MPPDPFPTLTAYELDRFLEAADIDALPWQKKLLHEIANRRDRTWPLAEPLDEKAELDEWRATYGRLDIPVTVIDRRPVYAGAAALGIALVARWVVRHGR